MILSLMKRKIIRQGDGGFTVTLPVAWIRDRELQAGDEVECTEAEQGLLLASPQGKQETSLHLDLSSFDDRMILNLLNQGYRLGYDVISATFQSPEQYACVERTMPMLLGFEIVEKDKYHCILQNIAEPDQEKFEMILRKLFLQLLWLSERVVQNVAAVEFKRGEYASAKLQIDKLTNFLRRTVIRTHYGGKKAALLYSVITQLSLIGHSYVYLYEYVADQKTVVSLRTKEHLSQIHSLLQNYYDAFYKKDLSLLSQIGKQKITLFKQNDLLLEKGKGRELVVLSYARETIRTIHMATPATIGYFL